MPQQKIASNELEFSSGVFPITGAVSVSAGSNTAPGFTTAGDTNTGIFFPAADTIAFSEGGVESMRINASGNIGIGVTPSAWSGFTAAQIKNGSVSTTGNDVFLNSNMFFNGVSWRYIASATAAQYYQDAGAHIWRNSVSGTAGEAASPSERMRITSDGNVGIGDGTITAASELHIYKSLATADISLQSAGGSGKRWIFQSNTDGSLTFYDNNATAERMRISSGGNVGIGVADPVSPLTVKIAAGSSVFPVPSQTAIGGGSSGRLNLIAQEPGLMINTDMNFATGTQTGTGTASLGLQIGLFGANDVRCMMFWAGSPSPLVFANASTPTGTITERMRITSGGIVTTPSQPAFLACRASTSSAITSGTTVLYDAVSYNTASMYNASTGRLTAPVAGVYAISYGMLASTDATVYRLTLNVNGGNFLLGGTADWNQLRLDQGTGIDYLQGTKSLNVYLNVGDFINLVYSADNGSSGAQVSWFFFSGYLLG